MAAIAKAENYSSDGEARQATAFAGYLDDLRAGRLADGIPLAWYRGQRRSPYEVLRERYARGFYTLAEFEDQVDVLLKDGRA